MAQAQTFKFGKQYLLLGNGENPEVFSRPCGITSLTRNVETNTSDVDIPDCDDPDAFNWLGIDVSSKRMSLQFSGVLAAESFQAWDTFSMDKQTINVRWLRDFGDVKGYWQGPAVLSGYSETADGGGRWNVSGTITFDGRPTWTNLNDDNGGNGGTEEGNGNGNEGGTEGGTEGGETDPNA